MDKKTEEFYERLKEELRTTSSWPTLYLYKFIVLSLYSGSEIYISQKRDKIGFNSLYLSSTIIKNLVL